MKLLAGWHLTVDCNNSRFQRFATELGTNHGASPDGKGDEIIIRLSAKDGAYTGFVDVTIGGMMAVDGLTDGEFNNTNIMHRQGDLEKIRHTLGQWIYKNYARGE